MYCCQQYHYEFYPNIQSPTSHTTACNTAKSHPPMTQPPMPHPHTLTHSHTVPEHASQQPHTQQLDMLQPPTDCSHVQRLVPCLTCDRIYIRKAPYIFLYMPLSEMDMHISHVMALLERRDYYSAHFQLRLPKSPSILLSNPSMHDRNPANCSNAPESSCIESHRNVCRQ